MVWEVVLAQRSSPSLNQINPNTLLRTQTA